MNFNVMNVNLISFLALLCLVFTCNTVNAKDIYQQSMVRLDRTIHNDNQKNNNVETLQAYRGKPMLMSFFTPNCKWCKKQHKSLKKMLATCPNAQVVMVGVQGNNQRLKQELRKERNKFPAYVANAEIINAIGKQSPVPQTLIFDSRGNLVVKTIGLTSIDKLQRLLLDKKISLCHS